ncbi:MAG: hypothetical protein M1812_002618 [Candelaria pacifica]|nr:MAG: hypothetical protein M1812_002618 [Candelaria pacifica]
MAQKVPATQALDQFAGSLDRSTWSKTLLDSRGAYTSLREHFLRGVEHGDELESVVDPLTEDEKSPWVAIRRDEALRDEILLDIDRCMPENLYFRQPETQKMMLDILFIFCKLNQDVGYRQGMHELLAPVLWVVERDAIEPGSHDHGHDKVQDEELLLDVLNPECVEHDSFTLFSLIMQTAKSFYELGEAEDHPRVITKEQPPTTSRHSPIVERSRSIHEDHLARADPELADRLKEIDVLPQIFLIRWIRLLFGREFPLDDLLALWDILFAEDPTLQLVDHICVAMLLRIRWQLVVADYSTALTLLLHYPSPTKPHSPSTFVQDALYLRNNPFDGGAHIVYKYSHKTLSTNQRQRGSSSKSSSLAPRQQIRTNSPLRAPGKFLKHQRGVEGMLQDAAKGVYSRGEKWGVTRVVRDAVGEVRKNVQGFQSGGSTQRNPLVGAGGDVDIAASVETRDTGVAERLSILETRNNNLAKMLEEALTELRLQQKALSTEDANKENVAEAIGVAIAKVQFVQFYLEDPMLSVPLPAQGEASKDTTTLARAGPPLLNEPQSPKPLENSTTMVPRSESPLKDPQPPASASESQDMHLPTHHPPAGAPATSTIVTEAQPKTSTTSMHHETEPSPFHRPRPSLTQSSFSWMLGEDQRRSSFVSSSPLPPDKRRGSAISSQTGSLFGEGAHGKGQTSGAHGKKADKVADEGFDLGSLRGGRPAG